MVQQVLGKRDIGGDLGRAIGGAFQQGAQESNQFALNRSRLNDALTSFESIPNLDQLPFSQQLTAAARALLPAPGGSQVLSELLPFLQKNAKAAAQNQALSGDNNQQQGNFNTQLPNFNSNPNAISQGNAQTNTNYPNVERAQTNYNTVPGKSTGPQTVSIKSGDEIAQAARQTQQRSLNTANPMSYEEAFNIETQKNNANAAYNQQLEGEKTANKSRQQEVNGLVNQIVDNQYPQASNEERSLFERWGNEAAQESEKESDIKNYVARKVRDYKTKVSNIESQMSRPNWLNKVYQGLQGNVKSKDQAKAELKTLVDPLIDAGMIDKARALVSGLDWMPVETEEIISEPLPRNLQNYISTLPMQKVDKLAKTQKVAGAPGLAGLGLTGSVMKSPEERQATIDETYTNLDNVFKNYRDANLVLLRDSFEKRGVNWNEFSEALNRLYSEGKIQFNDDQFKQLKNISEPPLSLLDQFLNNIGLKGK